MLNEGTIRALMHGQLFEPSEKMFESFRNNPKPHEITTGYYASVANKEAAVNLLDLAVLSALESTWISTSTPYARRTDRGRHRRWAGRGRGRDLTIIFLPLATGKDGKGFPKVVDRVYTRTTPGEVIDVVVTEEHARSIRTAEAAAGTPIMSRAKEFGVNLLTIEQLHEKSLEKAAAFGKTPPPLPTTDEVVT